MSWRRDRFRLGIFRRLPEGLCSQESDRSIVCRFGLVYVVGRMGGQNGNPDSYLKTEANADIATGERLVEGAVEYVEALGTASAFATVFSSTMHGVAIKACEDKNAPPSVLPQESNMHP